MKTALTNTRKFNSLETAKRAAANQAYWTPVLLGDDGRYWVPATNREAAMLIASGYEAV